MSLVLLPRFIGPIPVNVILEETHTSTLSITRNPIEFGADVTDHAYVEPKAVTLHGAIGSDLSAPGFPYLITAAAWQSLVALQESREPFDLITGLDIYENMLIETLETNRNPNNFTVLEFNASLIEVIFAESETTSGSASNSLDSGAKTESSGVTDRGQQTTNGENLDPATIDGARNRSILDGMFGDDIGD